jgi:hypothetical protein
MNMISNAEVKQNISRYLKTLGICWLVYGVLCFVSAVWLIFFTNTATVMFGALLARVPDPFSMMTDFHFVYDLMNVLSTFAGIVAVLAGVALLAGMRLGRTLALFAGFLSLSSIPLGTTLGIYTLIVLLPLSEGYTSSVGVETQPADLRHQSVTIG